MSGDTFNVNDEVYFELTDVGKNIWDNYVKRLAIPETFRSLRSQIEKHPTKMVLWEFMQIFGGSYQIGREAITKGNILSFRPLEEPNT